MKKLIYVLISITLAISLLAGCTNNDSLEDLSFEKVQSNGVLVVGIDDSFPPMGYMDTQTGCTVGFDVDLALEVSKRLGLGVRFQPIKWQTKELELAAGNIDCVWNGMSKTQALDQALNLSKPYMRNHQCIIVKKDSPLNTINDLKGTVFCVQNESSAEHALNKTEDFKNSLKNIVTTDTYTKAIFELNNSTVDAVGIDEVIARFYMSKDPNAYRLLSDENGEIASLAQEDYVIGFRKNDEKLKLKIEETLKSMSNDNTVSTISSKWFSSDITCINEW